MKDTVTIRLLHLGMNVVARITKFGNLLGEQLDAIDRVAKDNALIDFKLGKERIEAVNLLSLFDVRIKLRDTSEGEFVHEVDTVWVWNKLLAKLLDSNGKGGAKETNLVLLVAHFDNLLKDRLEFG
jgi:hypothetical protein